jgi:hypothetical protein
VKPLRRRTDPEETTSAERLRALLGSPPAERAGLTGPALMAWYRHAFCCPSTDPCAEGLRLRELTEDERDYLDAAQAAGFDHTTVYDALCGF